MLRLDHAWVDGRRTRSPSRSDHHLPESAAIQTFGRPCGTSEEVRLQEGVCAGERFREGTKRVLQNRPACRLARELDSDREVGPAHERFVNGLREVRGGDEKHIRVRSCNLIQADKRRVHAPVDVGGVGFEAHPPSLRDKGFYLVD